MDKAPESEVATGITSEIKAEPQTEAQAEPKVETASPAGAPAVEPPVAAAAPEVEAPQAEAATVDPQAARRWSAYVPLAASVAVALVVGGALGSAAVVYAAKPAAPPVDHTAAKDARALKDTVARLSTELSAFKSSLDAGHRTATTQFNKISDRMDRVEKAQAEPAAKLAKIADAVDRLEHRLSPTAVAAAASSDITNSIPAVAKPGTKPATLEGWTLVEFGSGRAVVENRRGQLFEVGPGSNLPGVGKVASIKRQDGRVVVSTPKGIIVSMAEPRQMPARYYPEPYRPY